MGLAEGLGGIGSGLYGLFGHQTNPYKAPIKTIGQIPEKTAGLYKPYVDAGASAVPKLEDQYNSWMTNPGKKVNEFGGEYQQSPGFQFALQQALQGANQSAAAGGMAGSPASQQQNMGIATGMANQDYNTWLDKVLAQYNEGLHGEQGTANRGQSSAHAQADQIAQAMAEKARMQAAAQASQNQGRSNAISDIASGVGKIFF
jgi:hypothetical protein